jgi:hypothetical protein
MANKKITPKIGSITATNKIPVLTDKVPPGPGSHYKRAGLATFHAGERAIANAEKKKKRSGPSRSGGSYASFGRGTTNKK